jgi:phage host-nuclease inhibitor protein Gam
MEKTVPKHSMSLRFSLEEFNVLQNESRRLGVSMNTLVAFCVVNFAPQVEVTEEEIPVTVKRVVEVEIVQIKRTLKV